MLFEGDVTPLAAEAKRYLTTIESFHDSGYNRFSINPHELDLPEEFSLMELDSDLVVSAIKKAEDSDSIVLRAFNPAQQTVKGRAAEASR